ncbi:MAG: class I SAM-dependent methyltransferase [Sulfuricella denitrificans]|nr:class I SAM-dependent methyltransferase [Sulfuricella denitrificans]
MPTGFSDHFSAVAADYASFRPEYPAGLFAWLARMAPDRKLAWDCAAGSGQATLALTEHFDRVVASDASPAQIAAARPHPAVEYRVATAEASGLPDSSAGLITVAQALHWFDLEKFYAEAQRVLMPRGILAVWSYGINSMGDTDIDHTVQAFYSGTVSAYWPPERILVESGYRTLPFPYPEMLPPPFAMEAAWTLPELLGYFRSWSATARFIAERGHDPIPGLGKKLQPLWGNPNTRRKIRWPLSTRIGRKPA